MNGADAYAIWCGIVKDEEAEMLAEKVAEKYNDMGHFDNGFLGTDILMEVLIDYGYADIALKLLESEELGSFLYMKRNGATTIWEQWHGFASLNHPMYGSCVRQLFNGFLGIRQSKDSAGYNNVEIRPLIPKKLDYVKGSIMTPKGQISVA